MVQEKNLTFSGHLGELRRALTISGIAVVIGFGVAVGFSDELDRALRWPIRDLLPPGTEPSFLGIFEPIFYRLKLGLIGGIFLASPVIFQQLWWFVAPGLTPRERRLAVPFILLATLAFLGGAAFCYFLILPQAAAFAISTMVEGTQLILSMQNYLGTASSFVLAFGLVFETPVLVVLLASLGLVTARGLARVRKYVVLVCFIVGAIITPTPDPFNQTIVAVPMYLLYELGVLGAWLVTRKRRRQAELAG
jgi:sec-independent protein translocase protein TatC